MVISSIGARICSRDDGISLLFSLSVMEPPVSQSIQPDREDWTPRVYDELRRLAHYYMSRERAEHTLQTTALVHEAYLRLAREGAEPWNDRRHFLAAAAVAMRRILVDHALNRKRLKRGGGLRREPLEEAAAVSSEPRLDFAALDEALRALEHLDARKGRVVELRFFGGMTIEETAEVLGVSVATVQRDWEFSRVWLVARMAEATEHDA